MATNKNAIVRYRALDKCFSSRTRKYYMNDLIEACRMAVSYTHLTLPTIA